MNTLLIKDFPFKINKFSTIIKILSNIEEEILQMNIDQTKQN